MARSSRTHGAFDDAQARGLDEIQRRVLQVGIKRQFVEFQLRVLYFFTGSRIKVGREVRVPVIHRDGVVVEEGRRNERKALVLVAGDQRVDPWGMTHLGGRQIEARGVIDIGARPDNNGIESQLGHDLVGLLEIHARSQHRRRYGHV